MTQPRLLARAIPLALGIALAHAAPADAQTRARRDLRIPDIPGFTTLKVDLHTHTVFSDGRVWPDVRAEEAWREGLDAVAITDHIEHQPHAADLPTAHDRPFEIATAHGERLDLLVIRGSEITRSMPPGHLNAVFLERVTPIETEAWRDAVKEAHDQGAFIFWNHPSWRGQQPDGTARWYAEHDELVAQGRLHGIEVVNGRWYSPEAHRWCLEKNLAILSNSDVHNPALLDYALRQGDLRPFTLVFAKGRAPDAIREALFARRTAAYDGGRLIGHEAHLRPLFDASITRSAAAVVLAGRRAGYVQIRNDSDLDYRLVARGEGPAEVQTPRELVLRGRHTVLLSLRARPGASPGKRTLSLPFTVDNLLVGPDEGLAIEWTVDVELAPAP